MRTDTFLQNLLGCCKISEDKYKTLVSLLFLYFYLFILFYLLLKNVPYPELQRDSRMAVVKLMGEVSAQVLVNC